ncbi:hypothetical protein [Cellulomonas citrea]|uniref:hypothetical protein n=1 Tax=Cellulomonas citrea TaxID=1909423 RepID=UPI0013596928|nr:hypothetical protein [Cellulomonas citrea]
MANVPFTHTDAGKTAGTTTPLGGALSPGDTVAINDSTDLSTAIVGNSGAFVRKIELVKQAGFYGYVVNVVARGPKGLGSGWMHLYFTDKTGDRYALGIWDSEEKQHTVAYNSSDPGIVKIEWTD